MAWLYVPSTALPYVPGLEDLSSASNWPSEMPTGLSLGWNGTPLPPESWSRVSKKNPWLRSLSGLTYGPSTAQRGVESWISSLRASRASHSAWPAKVGETRTRATSGRTSPESSENAAPLLSSVRTFRGSSQLGLPMDGMPTSTSRETYERWVTALRRTYSARLRLARHTSANGFLSWPTPDTMPEAPNLNSNKVNGPKSLLEAARMVPSWTTPNAHDGRRPGADTHSTQGANLNRDAVMWATPLAADDGRKVTSNSHQSGLIGQTARFSLPPQTTPTDGAPSSPSGPTSPPRLLNPSFDEWLMGWPVGWTSLAPLGSGSAETELYLSVQRSLLSRLVGGLDV